MREFGRWCTILREVYDVQGFTAVKRPREARLGSGEKIAKDDALTKLGSKKSVLASPAGFGQVLAQREPPTAFHRPYHARYPTRLVMTLIL